MKKIWGWIVGALGAVAAVLGFLLWRKYQKDHVNTLKDALSVQKAEREVAVLTAKREAVEQRVDVREDALQELDEKLAKNQRAIVEARTGAKQLDEQGVLAEYRRLGYIK